MAHCCRPASRFDQRLSLVFAELDLARRSGKTCSSLAYASWLICRTIGNELYESGACQDLFWSLNEHDRTAWQWAHQAALAKFSRLNRIDEEAQSQARSRGSVQITSSAESLALSILETKSVFWNEDPIAVETLVLVRSGLIVDLRFSNIRKINLPAQLQEAVLAFVDGAIDKQDYFHKVWGEQRFVSELHDDVIRRSIYRLRKATGLSFVSLNSVLELPQTLVLEV